MKRSPPFSFSCLHPHDSCRWALLTIPKAGWPELGLEYLQKPGPHPGFRQRGMALPQPGASLLPLVGMTNHLILEKWELIE